jgi:hypothetical protein
MSRVRENGKGSRGTRSKARACDQDGGREEGGRERNDKEERRLNFCQDFLARACILHFRPPTPHPTSSPKPNLPY